MIDARAKLLLHAMQVLCTHGLSNMRIEAMSARNTCSASRYSVKNLQHALQVPGLQALPSS